MDKTEVLDIVYAEVDELNAQLSNGQKLEKTPETALYGDDGPLDSLTLLNLLVGVEGRLEERGITLSLVDEDALSQADGPFLTIRSFSEYVQGLL
jgi:acyl carrier protein